MTLPDVFLIGAPKAGTTSLSRWLSAHPDLFFCLPKEPVYWATDYPRLREIRGFDDIAAYERLFSSRRAQEARRRAEGSTVYLYSHAAVPAIIEQIGERARFIVALRHPADLVISFHRTQQLLLNEDEPDLAAAWHRSLHGKLPATDLLDPKLVNYPMIGRLGQAVARLLESVPRQQVHFVRFEALRDAPADVWTSLTAFLSLSADPRPAFEVYNPSTRTFRSSRLHKFRNRPPARLAGAVRRLRHLSLASESRSLNKVKFALWWQTEEKPTATPALRAELTEYFADDVRLLGEQVGQDLTTWTTV